MEIRKVTCFECLKCRTTYMDIQEARKCSCDNKCSNNTNGFHSWLYIHSFNGLAFYKCQDCGKELIGITQDEKDPLDAIFVDKINRKVKPNDPNRENSEVKENKSGN